MTPKQVDGKTRENQGKKKNYFEEKGAQKRSEMKQSEMNFKYMPMFPFCSQFLADVNASLP